MHLTETCDPEGPNLITDVKTTAATVPDLKVLGAVHASLEERNLLPNEHLVDSGYMGSKEMADSLVHHRVDLFGPMPRDGSSVARQRIFQFLDLRHYMLGSTEVVVRFVSALRPESGRGRIIVHRSVERA